MKQAIFLRNAIKNSAHQISGYVFYLIAVSVDAVKRISEYTAVQLIQSAPYLFLRQFCIADL